jgi:hypothetical protein
VKTIRFAVATGAVVLGVGLASAALAHPVGTPGEPSCYGNRVSHGSSHSKVHEGHGLTPVERVEINEEFLGIDLSVKDFHDFVKLNCEGE